MVLLKLFLVCFALFSVFSIFCITSYFDDNVPVCNTKKLIIVNMKEGLCFLEHCNSYFCNRIRLQEN